MSAEKRQHLESMLDAGIVRITLDPTRDDVVVPLQFKQQESLTLNLSRNFGAIIALNDDAVRTVLSFNKVDYPCVLSWASIFDMICEANKQHKQWLKDIPERIRIRLLHEVFLNDRQRTGKTTAGLA